MTEVVQLQGEHLTQSNLELLCTSLTGHTFLKFVKYFYHLISILQSET